MLQLEIYKNSCWIKGFLAITVCAIKNSPKEKNVRMWTQCCVGGEKWKRSVGYWKCLCDLMLNFAWAKKGKRLWIMINTWFLLECQEWGKKWQKMTKWKLPVKLKLLKSCLLWDWQLYWKQKLKMGQQVITETTN